MLRKLPALCVAIALCLCGVFLAPTPAPAATVSLSYQGAEGVNFTVGGTSVYGSTAEFYTPSTYQGVDWIGYCVEPTQWFGNPLTVVSPNSWSGPSYGSANWVDAAWLVENFAPGLAWLTNPSSVNYGSSSVQNRIQAVQLAIWEVIVDPSASYSQTSLSTGNFRDTSSGVLATAGQYLAALTQAKQTGGGTASLSSQYNVAIGQSSSSQDILLVSASSSAVPEPASILLTASGLGVLAWWRRRRQPTA